MLTDSSPSGLISGLVVVPGEVRHLRVHEELLVLSAEPWLAAHAERYRRCAERMALSGGSRDAAAVARDLAFATRLTANAGWLEDAGAVWPEVARRASVPEWRVEDAAEAEGYARRLVERDAKGAEGVEWVYGVGGDGAWTLLLPPRLHGLLAYVGPYVDGGLATRDQLAGFVELLQEARVG